MTEAGMEEFRPGGLELTDRAAELMGLKPGDRVLDIGCGLGDSLEHLRRSLGIVPRGVDISPETVALAGRDYITLGDAHELPFPDGCFDGVLLECVLSLLEEPEGALRQAARVLRPGGALAISALSAGDGAALRDRGRIDFDRLSRLLRERGFTLTALEDHSAALRQLVAQAIFRYGSLEEYARQARSRLRSGVLDCSVPPRGTGYMLLTARKD